MRLLGVAVSFGLLLMFVPSTFDVWMLSYHRLLGVVLLILAISPRRLQALVESARERDFPGIGTFDHFDASGK